MKEVFEQEVPAPLIVKTSHEQSVNDAAKRKALDHHDQLEHNLASIFKINRSRQLTQSELENVLTNAQSHVAGLQSFLGGMVETKIYNERKGRNSTAAQRTFQVAELLGMVLEQ